MGIDNSSEWDVCDTCGLRHPPFEPGMYIAGEDVDVVAVLIAHMTAEGRAKQAQPLLDAINNWTRDEGDQNEE